MSEAPKVIGYYMRANKVQSLNWHEQFIPAAEKRGYKVIPFDGSDPSIHVDVVIAKLTDEFGSYDLESSRAVVERFQKLEAANVTIIDPVEAQRVIADRKLFSETLCSIPFDSFVENPHYCIVDSEEKLESSLNEFNISFPVIVKPLIASGSLAAHEMGIVFNMQQLKAKINYPAMIQEYFNHDGVIYKASVIGTYFNAVARPSFHNFEDDHEPVIFNSQNMSSITDNVSCKTAEPLNESELLHMVKALASSMGFHLYGFDVIKNSKTGKLSIIDANFFPSFRTVSDFPGKLLDLVDMVIGRQH